MVNFMHIEIPPSALPIASLARFQNIRALCQSRQSLQDNVPNQLVHAIHEHYWAPITWVYRRSATLVKQRDDTMDIFFTQNVWRHLVCRQDLVSPRP